MTMMKRAMRTILIMVLVIVILVPGALAMSFKGTTTQSTRVYASPTENSKSMKVGSGCGVTVTACTDGWARVTKNGVTGYIRTDALKPSESGKLKNAVAFALLQMDKPYGVGAPYHFNCSSLINYCYGRYGIAVGGSAAEIAADNRLKGLSAKTDLKLGDILCFDCDSDGICDHVAIYLAGNRFLHASYTNGCVTLGTLTSWYREHMLGVRRV